MKKYKLKKDFPGSKIGDVWVKAEDNVMSPEGKGNIKMHGSLFKPFNEWFGEYKEPKVGYIIDPMEEDCVSADDSGYEESDTERAKELGIWFETKEEAEKAVEKFKAWKRLENKGFRFTGLGVDHYEIDDIKYEMEEPPTTHDCQEMKDLKLLFGGENE